MLIEAMQSEQLSSSVKNNPDFIELKKEYYLAEINYKIHVQILKGRKEYIHFIEWSKNDSQEIRNRVCSHLENELDRMGYLVSKEFKKGVYVLLMISWKTPNKSIYQQAWENSTQPEFNIEGEIGIEN